MVSKIVLIIMLFLSPATSARGFPIKFLKSVVGDLGSVIPYIANCFRSDFSNCTLTPTVGSVKDDEESAGINGYQVVIEIGEPPVQFIGIFDTSSSLIWTQCEPCVSCFPQANSIFDPSKSKTFSNLPCDSPFCLSSSSCSNQCNYTKMYGEHLSTEGVLATETLTFPIGNYPAQNIVFGCGHKNEGNFNNASGVIGLGRDKWSLPSQLRVHNFSYCFNSNTNLGSSILFDSEADMNGSPLQSTPLLQNPNFPSAYYVNLTGISVADELLPIPSTTFDLQPNGTGGLILDSLIFVTFLKTEGYKLVKEAVKSRVDLPVSDGSSVGLDLCFSFSNISQIPTNIPNMTLHFDDANMVLQSNEYMYILQDEPDGLLCMTILPDDGISVLGNLQQVDKKIFFDIKNSMLSFQTTNCSTFG